MDHYPISILEYPIAFTEHAPPTNNNNTVVRYPQQTQQKNQNRSFVPNQFLHHATSNTPVIHIFIIPSKPWARPLIIEVSSQGGRDISHSPPPHGPSIRNSFSNQLLFYNICQIKAFIFPSYTHLYPSIVPCIRG